MTKPKLLFFRPKYGPTVPEFLVVHRDEHARCLSTFFNLTIIEHDCDYQQACDKEHPDACLVEIGLQTLGVRQPRITNARNKGVVPWLALMHADVWGQTRSSIFAELQAHDFDAIFSICTTAGEHFPDLKPRLYYWPNFIDENIFRDYQIPKKDIILFTGALAGQYPWRKRVMDALAATLTVNHINHAGYIGKTATRNMPVGSAYARVLGSAWFSPTCGTVANELVRKHLEIPAVGTCLITERTPTLELAGYSDMQNVVFADQHDVVDKVNYLLRNRDTLMGIIANGQALVHNRHTMLARSQIYDWVMLRKQADVATSIVQPHPFSHLVLKCSRLANCETLHVSGHGKHLRLLEEAISLIDAGRLELATLVIEECARLMPIMPDVVFLQAFCRLHNGNAAQSLELLIPMLKTSLDANDTVPPDPMEWAYLIIALLALGRLRAAYQRARQFFEISNPELDRARAAVFFLARSIPPTTSSRKTMSIHRLQGKGLSDWMALLAGLLERNGQARLSKRLKSFCWESVRNEADIYDAIRKDCRVRRRSTPIASGRLRRWDNPLLASAILRYLRRTLAGFSLVAGSSPLRRRN